MLALESQGSSVLRTYAYGGELISMGAAGARFYFHHDALGTVSAITKSTGSTQWKYTYDPYGGSRTATKVDSTAPDNPMRYTGGLLDSETSLYDLRARNYDPSLGAFQSVDPLAQDLNRAAESVYLYADAQPLLLSDPSGRMAVVDPGTQAQCPDGSWVTAGQACPTATTGPTPGVAPGPVLVDIFNAANKWALPVIAPCVICSGMSPLVGLGNSAIPNGDCGVDCISSGCQVDCTTLGANPPGPPAQISTANDAELRAMCAANGFGGSDHKCDNGEFATFYQAVRAAAGGGNCVRSYDMERNLHGWVCVGTSVDPEDNTVVFVVGNQVKGVDVLSPLDDSTGKRGTCSPMNYPHPTSNLDCYGYPTDEHLFCDDMKAICAQYGFKYPCNVKNPIPLGSRERSGYCGS
jgi:RHS repeat-associated protein